MRELAPRYYPSGSPVSPVSRFGGQPFVIGATALLANVEVARLVQNAHGVLYGRLPCGKRVLEVLTWRI